MINDMTGDGVVNAYDALLAFHTLTFRDSIRNSESAKAGIVGAFITGTNYQKTLTRIDDLFKSSCSL